MGNFLADLGRSGAGTSMVKGISDLTTDIQNRRLNEQQGQISIQDSRIRAENEAREARAFGYKEKAMLEQQAIDDASVNITTDQKFLSAPPETQLELLKWGQSQGYWDERGIGKRKFARTALGEIETKPELFDRFMGPVVLAKENEVKRLKTELLKMDSEGVGVDDKKYLEIKALAESKEKQYNQALTMYEGQRNKLLGITAAERKSTEQPIGPNKWGLSETMTFSQAKELGIDVQPKETPDMVEIDVNGQKVKVSSSVYVAHMDRQASREQALEIAKSNLSLRKDIADMTINLKKRIPASQVKGLNDSQVTLDQYAKFLASFEDAYAGSKVLGPTMTEIYSRLGSNQGRVNWWKQFKLLDSNIRHELFGATLTGYEKKSWDAVTVSENTDPIIVRQQLAKRLEIATNALERQVEGFAEKGYGKSAKIQSSLPKKVIERRKTASGKILVKYSDGTIGEE